MSQPANPEPPNSPHPKGRTSPAAYPLTYCSNVLPGETLQQACEGLERSAVPLRDLRRARGETGEFALGLWWSHGAVQALERPGGTAAFAEWMEQREFGIATLNCFPYGGFHDARVKREVYRPGWHQGERLDHTLRAARCLAQLVPEGRRIPISTLSGTHKEWQDEATLDLIAEGLARCAIGLHRLAEETGRDVVLAIEPEPYTTLETTLEVVQFFQERLFSGAGARLLRAEGMSAEDLGLRLGLCYDTCHQAVEFESPAEALGRLRGAGVPVFKMQLSSALSLPDPASNPEGLEVLRRFVEPRYLHQTMARTRSGQILRWEDLDGFFADAPALDELEGVRSHFHVPIDREHLGALGTTQADLRAALAEVLGQAEVPTLEVETYTFAVFPEAGGLSARSELVDSLDRELEAARRFVAESLSPGGSSSA